MTKSVGRLLVVDDNEMNREMLSRRLVRNGFEVDIAADGYQALEMVDRERFDLILLDIMMPGISGIEVLETIRRKFSAPDLPIIMATAKTHSDDMVNALSLGANDYITKPIDFSGLLARIDTHLKLKNLFRLKDEFLSMASHDLKNPLFVIVCQAYLIQQKLPVGTPMTQEALNMVSSVAQHAKNMQEIIADFLDFQAVEDGHIKLKLQVVNMVTLGQKVVDNFQPYAAEKEITLSIVNCSGDLPPLVKGDTARLEQVVQNLVGNALKFNPTFGRVVLEVDCQPDVVRMSVKDKGHGLSEADLEKAFVRAGKLSRKPTGSENSSGLGLAICKKLVELHVGSIGVHNNPDGGACFWFELPRYVEGAE